MFDFLAELIDKTLLAPKHTYYAISIALSSLEEADDSRVTASVWNLNRALIRYFDDDEMARVLQHVAGTLTTKKEGAALASCAFVFIEVVRYLNETDLIHPSGTLLK
jgi:hypothetical protein